MEIATSAPRQQTITERLTSELVAFSKPDVESLAELKKSSEFNDFLTALDQLPDKELGLVVIRGYRVNNSKPNFSKELAEELGSKLAEREDFAEGLNIFNLHRAIGLFSTGKDGEKILEQIGRTAAKKLAGLLSVLNHEEAVAATKREASLEAQLIHIIAICRYEPVMTWSNEGRADGFVDLVKLAKLSSEG